MVRLDINNKTLIIKQKGVKSNLEKEWRIILNEIKNIYVMPKILILFITK